MFEGRHTSTSHISQNRLSEMPTQKLINRSIRIIEELLVKLSASNTLPISSEEYNLVVILKQSLVSH